MGGRLRLVAALGLVALAVLVSAASAAVPRKPPAGKVLLGVVGPDPDGFDRLAGWSGGSGVDELWSKPHGLALYRKSIKNARYFGSLP